MQYGAPYSYSRCTIFNTHHSLHIEACAPYVHHGSYMMHHIRIHCAPLAPHAPHMRHTRHGSVWCTSLCRGADPGPSARPSPLCESLTLSQTEGRVPLSLCVNQDSKQGDTSLRRGVRIHAATRYRPCASLVGHIRWMTVYDLSHTLSDTLWQSIQTHWMDLSDTLDGWLQAYAHHSSQFIFTYGCIRLQA